jgi:RecG-like helicase
VIAPITILAKQHLKYFTQFLADKNIRCEILIGGVAKKNKAKILQLLQSSAMLILLVIVVSRAINTLK